MADDHDQIRKRQAGMVLKRVSAQERTRENFHYKIFLAMWKKFTHKRVKFYVVSDPFDY